ncbi:tyrosine-type recombinase/integrase [Micromonospora sp. C72]|uniref:tyrosine-type recombinase/integrase n=1 Tax=Micromonospora sp. C72 TaxID=2824880 RepID=UPI001B35BC8D|nr:tyrosine-type recombinase/integrase [Micromonospora sp. C72]MBQ1045329.1 tyrosine-type recombinase/integrase [Micromonospora sp. C72]
MDQKKTCLEVALERLEERAIKESTYRSYLKTIRLLNLEDFPYEKLTPRILNQRLSMVLNSNTRRKHCINLRASLGIKLPTPRATPKEYDLPTVRELHQTYEDSPYRANAFAMLYAGARLGEAVIKQPIKGNVITFDRQRNQQYQVTSPKSAGPVVVPFWYADEYRATPDKDFERQHCSVYNGLVRWGVKMLGTPVNPHMLRNAFCMSLVNMGANPRILQSQMRHHHVSVSLQYYTQARQTDIAAMMERFGE